MVVIMYSPYIMNKLYHNQEGFQGKSGGGLLKVVGKNSLSPHTMYVNDYDSGNAKRYLSNLPSVINGGFGVPDKYTFYPVPDFHAPYKMAIIDEPRSSEFNRGSHNDPVHLYFQKLYGTLEDADKA